jgi:hypothetical protein
MTHNHSSRKGFLSTVALLSAGAVLGSPLSYIFEEKNTLSLEEKWSRFCQSEGGTKNHLTFSIKDAAIETICANHTYKVGEIIYFESENMLAQPIWIYWGNNKSKPDDVIISFFSNTSNPEKLFRLNQYELASIHYLAAQEHQKEILSQVNKILDPKTKDNVSFVKTTILKGKTPKIFTVYKDQQFYIETNFNNYI